MHRPLGFIPNTEQTKVIKNAVLWANRGQFVLQMRQERTEKVIKCLCVRFWVMIDQEMEWDSGYFGTEAGEESNQEPAPNRQKSGIRQAIRRRPCTWGPGPGDSLWPVLPSGLLSFFWVPCCCGCSPTPLLRPSSPGWPLLRVSQDLDPIQQFGSAQFWWQEWFVVLPVWKDVAFLRSHWKSSTKLFKAPETSRGGQPALFFHYPLLCLPCPSILGASIQRKGWKPGLILIEFVL